MAKFLIFEEVNEGGSVEVGRLLGSAVTVGREPGEGGIQLDRSAVSRQHGVFRRCGWVWTYQDLGSTNGSWVNGRRVDANRIFLVRSGDMVQLADMALYVKEAADARPEPLGVPSTGAIAGRSLLAFRDGEFLEEFPVPEYGRALVIGGASPDLELEGDLFEMPSLVVERRGDAICAYSVARELAVQLNGENITETTALKDSDELRISNYTVVLNDPTQVKRAPMAGEIVGGGVKPSAARPKGWSAEQGGRNDPDRQTEQEGGMPGSRVIRKSVFGQQPLEDDEDETVPIDMHELQRGVISHPSMRSVALYRKDRSQRDYSLASLEDKVILGVGFTLLFALMVLVIWWAMG
ncbi:MAG: FHA domain-containing protein [Deltaproteobacteria bacterium]|nr:FHA domain-containing protein [Deltaproteobacteria bacterium]